jgi:signal transduction histidine kinase
VVRQLTVHGFTSIPNAFPFAVLTRDAGLLETACRFLDRPPIGFVDWNQPSQRAVYQAGLCCAREAEALARKTELCDPEIAWICGLLAPLGWLAVCAIDPSAAVGLAKTRTKHPGFSDLDPNALARRLARHWGLPTWLAAILGQLQLPTEIAAGFGADPTLFRLTRLAVCRAQEQGPSLGLTDSRFADEDVAALRLGNEEPRQEAADEEFPPLIWQDPYAVPLLRDLLSSAAENRRLRDLRLHQELEAEVDRLHSALTQRLHSEGERLQASKLDALAELAAGAGHEINNPLAVISGQAQYLLGHATTWFTPAAEEKATTALKAIVTQTRRIHSLLRDLMQFARPAPPARGAVDLPSLMGEVAHMLGDLALQRQVRIEVAALPARLAVVADEGQVRIALLCLLRNAIEAAPANGWARLVLAEPRTDRIEILVEDSGPGPEPHQRASLFDPFFSGRTAGRGRGLGLPIAWRLARQQGGEVRIEPAHPQRPTRFVLTLPRSEAVVDSQPLSVLPPSPPVATNGCHK